MRTSFIYNKPTAVDNQLSTVDGILKHFLKEKDEAKPSIETKVEGVSVKVFFREGKWIHFRCNKGYALPRVYVVPDTPKIRESFDGKWVEQAVRPQKFTYNSDGILDKTVRYELRFLASEKDVLLDYSDEEQK